MFSLPGLLSILTRNFIFERKPTTVSYDGQSGRPVSGVKTKNSNSVKIFTETEIKRHTYDLLSERAPTGG